MPRKKTAEQKEDFEIKLHPQTKVDIMEVPIEFVFEKGSIVYPVKIKKLNQLDFLLSLQRVFSTLSGHLMGNPQEETDEQMIELQQKKLFEMNRKLLIAACLDPIFTDNPEEHNEEESVIYLDEMFSAFDQLDPIQAVTKAFALARDIIDFSGGHLDLLEKKILKVG